MLAQLPNDLQGHIISLGGLNRVAEAALRRIQLTWRRLRNIARRRAAYMIQDAVRGERWRVWGGFGSERERDTAGLSRVRRYNARRAALRT